MVSRSEDGEVPPGEGLSIDEILVILLPAADNPTEDAYDPFLGPADEVDETEP